MLHPSIQAGIIHCNSKCIAFIICICNSVKEHRPLSYCNLVWMRINRGSTAYSSPPEGSTSKISNKCCQNVSKYKTDGIISI